MVNVFLFLGILVEEEKLDEMSVMMLYWAFVGYGAVRTVSPVISACDSS